MSASARILLNLTADSRRRVFTDTDIARLGAIGETVTFDPKVDDPAAFEDLVASSAAMLTCWGSRSVTLDDLPSGQRNSPLLVAHAAGSVRGLMPKAVLGRGDVRLSQGAAAMVPAVAQLTVGFMIVALRQGVYRQSLLKAGTKLGNDGPPYRDLTGLTVGLVSLSRVAQAVIPLLAPFGCRVIAWDPYWTSERAAALGVELLPHLDDLLAQSDVVSLHAPVTPETENLVNAGRIALLKPGTALINTARASVLDQAAAFARAAAGEIEYYTDVTNPEPLPPSDPAWSSPHIFITPHFAGPTTQTLRRMAGIAIDEIERFLTGQSLQHEVTFERYDILA